MKVQQTHGLCLWGYIGHLWNSRFILVLRDVLVYHMLIKGPAKSRYMLYFREFRHCFFSRVGLVVILQIVYINSKARKWRVALQRVLPQRAF